MERRVINGGRIQARSTGMGSQQEREAFPRQCPAVGRQNNHNKGKVIGDHRPDTRQQYGLYIPRL